MAQVHEGKQSRWLVIRRSFSKPKRDEVVARIPYGEWEAARDVCLRKYGTRARVISREHASSEQRKVAELLPVTYIPKAGSDGDHAHERNKPLARTAGGGR